MKKRLTRDRNEDRPKLEDLFTNLLVQAVKDAIKGEPDAIVFLADHGAEIAEKRGIASAERVRKWARNPRYPECLSVVELAERAGYTPKQIHGFIQRGDLICFPDGHGVKIPIKEAERFLKSHHSEERVVCQL